MREWRGVRVLLLLAGVLSGAPLTGCSAQAGAEAVARRDVPLTAGSDFEDASGWHVIAGNATIVDGGAVMRLANINGYVEVQNTDPYGTLTADGTVRLSVNIPDVPWGHAALYFDIPSRGIYRQYVGPVDLTPLPAGPNQLNFTLPAHIRTALAGSYSDFRLGIAFALPSGTTITLQDVCFSNCDVPPPEPLSWTSRDIWNLRNIGWYSHRGLTRAELAAVYDARVADGMIPINLGARSSGLVDNEFSIVWRENVDGRNWKAHWDLTSEQYHARWEQYRDEGYRPLGVTSYHFGGLQLFAGIWIENRENLGWASYRGLTNEEYADWFQEYRDRGYRPIDIDGYDDGGVRYATIWWENVDNVAWEAYRNMSRESYQERVDARAAEGFLMIDYDAYDDEDEYAAIWEKPAHVPAHQIRTGREERSFANLWRQYRDEGYRPFHVENHDDGDDHFAGIWIQNDDRFFYDRKGQIDTATQNYRSANDLPGISVAVIRAGEVIYRRGFGWADVDEEKVAHGETVYNAASVSKVIGGTLAAKLEAEGQLRDGTPVSLDMTQSTATYLAGLPAHHTHTVEQLTAHLGCVPHYDTSPSIENQTTHYSTAQAAVASIWNKGLVSGCTIGATRSYSTAAFTFVGAVLESVSGRAIQDLVRTEIAEPYGFTSMRSQWESASLPGNYERARPYDDDNDEDSYSNSSWKVLGGGIELNTVDLARFGAGVLYGQIVTPAVRDNRLFAAVAPGCGANTADICYNGVAWGRSFDPSGRRAMDHNGSWTGARSFVRIYPDDDLVVAIMSNRTEHNPDIWTLGDTIGDIVLAP
jgi:CubicO group peptidase (beta-lactamase class C family)